MSQRLSICAVLLLVSSSAFPDTVIASPDVTVGVVVRASVTSQSASVGLLRPGDHSKLLDSVPSRYRIRLGDGIQGFSKRRTHVVADPPPTPLGPTFSVARLDLGTISVLLMALLACCAGELAAQVLVVGRHGSEISSRDKFLNAVDATIFIVSAVPMKYGTVTRPEQVIVTDRETRGQVFRIDTNDVACKTNPAKIGPDADGRAGGSDNTRVVIAPNSPLDAVWHGVD